MKFYEREFKRESKKEGSNSDDSGNSRLNKKKKDYTKEYNIWGNILYTIKELVVFDRIIVVFLIVNICGVVILEYLPLITYKNIFFIMQHGTSLKNFLYVILVGYCVIALIGSINTITYANIWWRFIGARLRITKKRVDKVLNLKFEELESPSVQSNCQKAMRATESNNSGIEGMMHSFLDVTINILKIIVSYRIVWNLNPLIVFILLVICVFEFYNLDSVKKNDKKLSLDPSIPYIREQLYMDQKMNDFSYAKDIRLFSMKQWLLTKYTSILKILHNYFVGSKNRWIKAVSINEFLTIIEEGLIYMFLIYNVLRKDMSIDGFILYIGVISILFEALSETFNNLSEIRQYSREISDFRNFIECPNSEECTLKKKIPYAQNYNFHFENVSFRYPGSNIDILDNLNVTIEAGEKLAIVGLNGAGKTTLIKLLCGLYTPSSGRILLNGIDITSFDPVEYYLLFAAVFQNFQMFAFTLAENVSMKIIEETSEERVEECFRQSGLEDKITLLQEGIRTPLLKILYENGIDLSGGEKQKLAFARALYKDAPVVILDEPTSALDPLAEYQLYQKFNNMIGNKTAIFISHRLSSTKFCDKIMMFESGKIIEYGTHDTLIKMGKTYSNMYNIQSQYYKKGKYSFEEN